MARFRTSSIDSATNSGFDTDHTIISNFLIIFNLFPTMETPENLLQFLYKLAEQRLMVDEKDFIKLAEKHRVTKMQFDEYKPCSNKE